MMWKLIACILVLHLCICLLATADDDCDSYSDECSDQEQCCGGCCFHGECIDTYRSCLSSDDVCREHICHGSEVCVPYSPPQCPGCEPKPVCKLEDFKK